MLKSISEFNPLVFSDRLNALMCARNITNAQVSKDTGISAPSITKYRTHTGLPDLKCLYKLAQYFGVSIDWLLGLDDTHAAPVVDDDNVLYLYSIASQDDRYVVNAVLDKYKSKVNRSAGPKFSEVK